MGGAESLCMSCINRGFGGSNGYEYEIFQKMPFFGSVSNYLRFFNQTKGMSQGGSGSMISNIANMIPGFKQNGFNPSSLIPSGPGQTFPPGPGGQQTPMDAQSIFKMLNIRNLTPIATEKGSKSIFDLVGNDTFVRKIKKSNYNEVIKSMEGSNQLFTDTEFPPNNQSLGDLRAHGTNSSRISWKRIRDIMPNAVFIKDVIEPADILQGQLGDCYFLSALSALAEQGFRIKSLFPSVEMNQHGIYMARVLHNGQYQEVVIDDYFPVDENGKVFFAQPAGNVQIWVMVLEKIWAKLYGSYANIIGGLPNEVLHAFSSAPVYFQSIPSDPAKQELLWQKMLVNDKNGALLACGTKSDASIEEYGFVKGHAYTILGVYDRPQRMIKLRNPWGHKEWRGRASDHDLAFWNSVNATDKQLLDYNDHLRQKDSDGIFFVVWEDFLNFFQLVDICKIYDNAHYNFVPTEFNNLEDKLFEFQVKNDEPSLLTIAITQPSKRGTTLSSYSRNYAALGKWDEQYKCYRYVQSKTSKNFPDNFIEVERATTGKYCLYTKYLLNRELTVSKGSVSAYSLAPVAIKDAKGITSQKFLKEIMFDHASKNPKRKNLNNPNDWICSDILLNQGGFSYFAANVDSNSRSRLGVTLNENEYTDRRLVLLPPHKGCSVLKQEVKGGKPLVVVAELLSEGFPSSITNPSPLVTPLE